MQPLEDFVNSYLKSEEKKPVAKELDCQNLSPGLDSTDSSLQIDDVTDPEDLGLTSPDGESNLGLLIGPEEQINEGMIDNTNTASIFEAAPTDSNLNLFNDDSLVTVSDQFPSNDLFSV